MKSARWLKAPLMVGVCGFVIALTASGWAQVVVNSPGTVAGGNLQGLGDAISAAGSYNLSTSEAALNMSQVQKQEIENRVAGSEAYYQLRDMNDAYRAKLQGPRVSQDQILQFTKKGRPDPLRGNQLNPDGRIGWSGVLTTEPFADSRKELDALFLKRAENGGLGYEDQTEVKTVTNGMLDQLKEMVTQLPSNVYMSAKNFLRSLVAVAGNPA